MKQGLSNQARSDLSVLTYASACATGSCRRFISGCRASSQDYRAMIKNLTVPVCEGYINHVKEGTKRVRFLHPRGQNLLVHIRGWGVGGKAVLTTLAGASMAKKRTMIDSNFFGRICKKALTLRAKMWCNLTRRNEGF